MRILLLGSVALPIPPVAQGGTEYLAYHQALGLAEKGHSILLVGAQGTEKKVVHKNIEVIEIGKGDVVSGSQTEQQLDASQTEGSRKLRLEMVYLAQVSQVMQDLQKDYDVVLNNMRGEAVFLPIAKLVNKPFFTVMHVPLFAELATLFHRYKTRVITISNSQRKGFANLTYAATIYNAIVTKTFPFAKTHKNYLLMVGSIGKHKNQKDAIAVAQKTGHQLILAGKIRDKDYFETLKKDIDGKQIQYVGEVGFAEKIKLYQGARALLFPILWEEPFGLVMIEAMACGTPVIAYNHGAIPEVVVDGKTGFVVKNKEQMSKALGKIDTIDRATCRKHVEKNFDMQQMIDNYEKALKNSASA